MWKDRTSILVPDERYTKYLRHNDMTLGVIRPLEIEDLYDDIARLVPPASVPVDIARQFNVAKSAYLYSWFDYEMATLAEEHSYTVVEMAIQRRADQEGTPLPPKATMSVALDTATARGWLAESDFQYGDEAQKFSWREAYIKFRNDLMHGRPHLAPDLSIQMMELSLKLIARLFPQK